MGPAAIPTETATAAHTTARAVLRERGSGHHIQSATAASTGPITTTGPVPKATAAPGAAASQRDIHAVASNIAADSRINHSPISGTGSTTTAPPRPAHSAADTRGPAYAFAIGASSDTIPKHDAMTGMVTICATKVSAIGPAATRPHAGTPASAHVVAIPPKMSKLPTASTESWNPMS